MSEFETLLTALLNGETVDFEPKTRIEQYLKNCCDMCGCDGLPTPRSRAELLLYQLAEQLAGGGSGGGGATLAALIDKSITSVDIPSGTTNIGIYAFYQCGELTSVNIPNSVVSIDGGAFQYCSKLEGVTIPDSVATIANQAFNGCRALTSIIISNGIASIGALAFGQCQKLTSITCLAETPPTIYSSTFQSVSADYVVYVPAASVDAYKAATNWSTFADHIQAIPE